MEISLCSEGKTATELPNVEGLLDCFLTDRCYGKLGRPLDEIYFNAPKEGGKN